MSKERIEEIKQEFWQTLATGGMTLGSSSFPPEGYADWQADPVEAWDWFEAKLRKQETLRQEWEREAVWKFAEWADKLISKKIPDTKHRELVETYLQQERNK